MIADEIAHHRRNAAIGHERDLGPGHLVEHLGGQVHERAVAAMTDRELVALRLCLRNDVAQRRALERTRGRQNERRSSEA